MDFLFQLIMKIISATVGGLLIVLAGLTTVTSCSKTDRIGGLWQGTPERIHNLPSASDATSTISIDFGPRESAKGEGDVVLSAVIEIQQPLVGLPDTEAMQAPMQASVTATAQIEGKYIAEERDDDDLLLSLDPTTMTVTVDPAGVMLSENLLTGTDRSTLDSLTAATAERWRVLLTPIVRERFYSYRKIEDVKVHHSDMMSCEVADRDLTFRRMAQN